MATTTVGNVIFEISASTKQIQAQLKTLEGTFNSSFTRISGMARNLAGVFGIGFGVGAIVSFGKSIVSTAGQLQDLSERTGIAASTLSGFKSTLEENGTTIEAFARGVFMAQKELGAIKSATDPAMQAIKDLGLNYEDLMRSSPEDFIRKIGQALAKIEDPNKRAALGSDLLKRSYLELGPALSAVTARFDELKKSGMTNEQIQRLDDFGDAVTRLGNAAQIVSAGPLLEFVELIERLFNIASDKTKLKNSIEAVGDEIQRLNDMLLRRQSLRQKGGIWEFLTVPEAKDKEILAQREALFKEMEDLQRRWDELAAKTTPLKPPVRVPTVAQPKDTRDLWAKSAMGAEAELEGYNKALLQLIEIQDRLKAGGSALSAETLESLRKQLIDNAGAMEDLGGATDETRAEFYQLLDALTDLQQNAGFISAIPEMVRSVELELQRQQFELGNYPDELMPKTKQVVDDMQKEWESLFDSISSGIETTLQGVMLGTQSMGEAMRRLAQNIGISFLEEFNKLAVINPLKNWLFGLSGNQAAPTLNMGSVLGSILKSIPWFQSGGVVPGSPGQAVPIMAHAGERVIPRGQSAMAMRAIVNINGDIIPRQPWVTRDEVIQIGYQTLNERGGWMGIIEDRMSPRR